MPRAWHGAPGLAWSHTSGWHGGVCDHARPRIITWGLTGPCMVRPSMLYTRGGGVYTMRGR